MKRNVDINIETMATVEGRVTADHRADLENIYFDSKVFNGGGGGGGGVSMSTCLKSKGSAYCYYLTALAVCSL